MKQALENRQPTHEKPNSGQSGLLGKRHEYSDLSQGTLGQIAQRIGFSSSEIMELERLYVRRFKEMKHQANKT